MSDAFSYIHDHGLRTFSSYPSTQMQGVLGREARSLLHTFSKVSFLHPLRPFLSLAQAHVWVIHLPLHLPMALHSSLPVLLTSFFKRHSISSDPWPSMSNPTVPPSSPTPRGSSPLTKTVCFQAQEEEGRRGKQV